MSFRTDIPAKRTACNGGFRVRPTPKIYAENFKVPRQVLLPENVMPNRLYTLIPQNTGKNILDIFGQKQRPCAGTPSTDLKTHAEDLRRNLHKMQPGRPFGTASDIFPFLLYMF